MLGHHLVEGPRPDDASFRNHSTFHEECTLEIGERLAAVLKPVFLRVVAYWYPRGGMPIDVFRQSGKLPTGIRLPDLGGPALSWTLMISLSAVAVSPRDFPD
jgi:hypothetical protein